VDFPDTRDAEKISYNVVKSYYLYAENSITSKQKERYESVLSAYKNFSRRFPSSTFLNDAQKYNEQAIEKLEAFKNAANKS
jgi:outer membrane protein assembly factor BamD